MNRKDRNEKLYSHQEYFKGTWHEIRTVKIEEEEAEIMNRDTDNYLKGLAKGENPKTGTVRYVQVKPVAKKALAKAKPAAKK